MPFISNLAQYRRRNGASRCVLFWSNGACHTYCTFVRTDDIRRDSVVKSYPPTTPLSYSTPRTPKGERDKITLDTRTTLFTMRRRTYQKRERERDGESVSLSLPLIFALFFHFLFSSVATGESGAEGCCEEIPL